MTTPTPIIRTDRNQVFGPDGTLLSEEVVEVDITTEVNKRSTEDKLRAGLATISAQIATTNATINANPASYIKDQARLIRFLIRLALDEHDVSE